VNDNTLRVCRLHLANQNSSFSKSFDAAVVSDGNNVAATRHSFLTNDGFAKSRIGIACKMMKLSETELVQAVNAEEELISK